MGKYINELRKKTTNEMVSKRAKDLVRHWRKLIIPHDSSGVRNGEHGAGSLSPCSVISSHLPGPGPGPGLVIGGSKPASPSLLVNHHRSLKGMSGLAQTSPGNSQCSSASTSPSVTPGMGRLGSSRPSTPSVASPYVSKLIGAPSGTTVVDGRLVSNQHAFKPVSPAAATIGMNRITAPGGSSAKQIVNRLVTSPPIHCSPTFENRTRNIGPGVKRPRTDEDESCDSQGKQSSAGILKNSSSPPSVGGLINGVDAGDSMDSVPSYSESLGDPFESKDSSSGGTNLAKFRKKNSRVRPEKCDMLKEKLASHMRTPKVKTTAELIQELKARNSSGSCSAVRSSPPILGVTGNGENHTRVMHTDNDSNLVHTRKVVYSSLLGTDEDVTRNKTELMEKFLKDSVGTDVSSSLDERLSKEYISKESPVTVRGVQNCKQTCDPVDDILATLPPVNLDDIKWDDDDNEINVKNESSVRDIVTDEVVQRLLTKDWENVNGISDYKGDFRRWNEIVTRKSYNEDSLHILPYVDID